jgi:DDE superfamily endonuclease
MSKRPWNTVKERKYFGSLSEICLEALDVDCSSDDDDDDDDDEDEDDGEDDDADDEWSGWSDWDTDDDSLVESADTVDMMLELTMSYGTYITRQLETDIDFDKPPLRVAHLSEVECVDDFRFRKEELEEFIAVLKMPMDKELIYVEGTTEDMVICKHRYTILYETGILMILFRLARPRRVRADIEHKFSCRRARCSAVCGTFIDALNETALPYLTNAALFQPRFPMYADKIANKCTLAAINIWGFIDGTLKKVCRPSKFQKAAYSGHKRIHGIKFQNVTTPDGFISNLFGPIAGSRHDSYMLSMSNLLPQLATIMPASGPIYALYGDPAYPQSEYLIGSIGNAQDGSV